MKLIYKVLIVFFVVMFSVIIFLTNKYTHNSNDAVKSPIAMESAKGVEADEVDLDKNSEVDDDECIHIQIEKTKKALLKDFDKESKNNKSNEDNASSETDDKVLDGLKTAAKKEDVKLSFLELKAREAIEKNVQALEKNYQSQTTNQSSSSSQQSSQNNQSANTSKTQEDNKENIQENNNNNQQTQTQENTPIDNTQEENRTESQDNNQDDNNQDNNQQNNQPEIQEPSQENINENPSEQGSNEENNGNEE